MYKTNVSILQNDLLFVQNVGLWYTHRNQQILIRLAVIKIIIRQKR